VIVRTRLLLVAGVLLALSLGLPWSHGDATTATVHGFEHTMRVNGAAAALLVLAGVRAGRRSLVVLGLRVAADAIPIGGMAGESGRIAYALAIVVTALALDGRGAPRPTTAPSTPPAPT
jgi:hypothetical protein